MKPAPTSALAPAAVTGTAAAPQSAVDWLAPAEPLGKWLWIGIVALIAATCAAFYPTLRSGYIWDDEAVRENALLRTPDGLARIWTQPSLMRNFESHYWPMVYTSFWIEYRLYGAKPVGHHAVNLAFHAANAVLLWLLLRRLRVAGAWFGAALFALHPVHVESVAWIIERKDVLSGIFYLGAFLAFLRYVARASRVAYGGALLLFVCAMLSKSIAISFPIALLLVFWWKEGGITKRRLLETLPFFAVSVAIGAGDVMFAHGNEPVDVGLTLFQRGLLASSAVGVYAWKLLWPANLMAIYPRWNLDPAAVYPLLYPVGVLAVLVGSWSARRRIGRGPLVAVLFYCVTLGPVLGIIPFSFMTYSYVADRFQYLASAGLIAGAGAGLALLARRYGSRGNAALWVVGGALLVVLGALTFRQSGVYRDLETFWGYNYGKNNTHLAGSALGDVYLRRGELDRAEELQREALGIRDGARARFRLGEVHMKRGEYDAALGEFLRAEQLNQGTNRVESLEPGLYFNIGSMYWRSREYEKCREYWAKALKANPDMPEAKEWLPKVEERLRRSRTPGS